MAELLREIVKEDLPIVRRLLTTIGRDDAYLSIDRLGGMTNHSYKVVLRDGEELLVRIPGEGTEEMINRLDERKSTKLACKLKIDSELLYFGDDGTKVMKFIHDPQLMSEEVLRKKENLLQAAEVFRKLHTCGIDTGVRFEVFEMAELYEKLIKKYEVAFYSDYLEVKKTVFDIKNEVDGKIHSTKVPCHNDSLVDNWVLDGNGKLYLIDWEYSGMNEAMWDLSCLSIEADYSNKDDDELLRAYFERNFTLDEKKYFIATKLYVDYLWTLWGLTRIPYDGQFMQEYADNRYDRLKKNIKAYKEVV